MIFFSSENRVKHFMRYANCIIRGEYASNIKLDFLKKQKSSNFRLLNLSRDSC